MTTTRGQCEERVTFDGDPEKSWLDEGPTVRKTRQRVQVSGTGREPQRLERGRNVQRMARGLPWLGLSKCQRV